MKCTLTSIYRYNTQESLFNQHTGRPKEQNHLTKRKAEVKKQIQEAYHAIIGWITAPEVLVGALFVAMH